MRITITVRKYNDYSEYGASSSISFRASSLNYLDKKVRILL